MVYAIRILTLNQKRTSVQTGHEEEKDRRSQSQTVNAFCFAVLLAAVMHGGEMWNEVKDELLDFCRATDRRQSNHPRNRLIIEEERCDCNAGEMEGDLNMYRNDRQRAKPKVRDKQGWKKGKQNEKTRPNIRNDRRCLRLSVILCRTSQQVLQESWSDVSSFRLVCLNGTLTDCVFPLVVSVPFRELSIVRKWVDLESTWMQGEIKSCHVFWAAACFLFFFLLQMRDTKLSLEAQTDTMCSGDLARGRKKEGIHNIFYPTYFFIIMIELITECWLYLFHACVYSAKVCLQLILFVRVM